MPADYVKVGRFEMARVKIISGTVVNGRPVGVGDVVDVSGSDYYFLVGAQRAVKYVEPEKPKEEVVTAPALPAEPVVVAEAKPERYFVEEVVASKKGRRK
jgi:hypothetical protein